MTKWEKEILAKIYDCVKEISKMSPLNPADIKQIVINHHKMIVSAKTLRIALDELWEGRIANAMTLAIDAKEELQ